MRQAMLRLIFFGCSGCLLSGCVAYTVVDTASSVTATAVETTVDVTAGDVDLVVPEDDD